MRVIKIFDTTLRDGEQSPGASMNVEEKIKVARQLADMKVDIIEAGFPFASPGDFQAVQTIAREIGGVVIAGLCRTKDEDIDTAARAIEPAERRRIHTFLATSDLHLTYKLKMSREDALERAVAAVKRALRYTDDVEFSAEDASRSDMDYLCRVVEAVIDAGATTVNIPDTVGYMVPDEFGAKIAHIMNHVPNVDKTVISVHCHNDLGLGVANSLAAIQAGAGQVECTVNGIGERAGNAAMEEIVMALNTRPQYFEATTNIVTEEIYRASRLVSRYTWDMPRNKAIVGKNAFAHESGIHQDGYLKEKSTYEIMRPETVGIPQGKLVLGKHSGRAAFRARLEELGYSLDGDALNHAFERFKHVADQKKEVFDEDLVALVSQEIEREPETFSLEGLEVRSGTSTKPTATVRMGIRGDSRETTMQGDGPVDAVYRAISSLTGTTSGLERFEVKGITGGMEALGEVQVTVSHGDLTVRGYGADTDIIIAAAQAYITALNKLELLLKGRKS